MMTFDRGFARLLLEICRYTYAAGFDDRLNAGDKQDALNWIKTVGGLLTDEPIILRGSKTSVACIAAYPDRNIVAYMGTKTQFNTFDNAMASIKDWSENFEALLAPFKLTSEQLGTGHPQDVDKDDLGGRVHHGFLEELAAVQGLVAEELLKRGGRSRPTYITGHSQGGAEAGLATRAARWGIPGHIHLHVCGASSGQFAVCQIHSGHSPDSAHRIRGRHCPACAADPARQGNAESS
jgi:lipase (class 3)